MINETHLFTYSIMHFNHDGDSVTYPMTWRRVDGLRK